MSTAEHKAAAPAQVRVGIITVSTSRGLAEDKSGQWMRQELGNLGHAVIHHEVVPDDAARIRSAVEEVIRQKRPQIILLDGGTGISPQDVTIETLRPLFSKELTGFATAFARLSYDQIGSAAILSRATAGTIGSAVVFCLPGSLNACKLACQALVFPELGHLVKHLQEE